MNTTGESEDADAEPPDLETLRQRLARRRTRQEGASTETTGEGSTPAVPTGSGTEAARRDGPSGEAGTETEKGNGDGVEGPPSVSLEYDDEGNVVSAVLEESSGNAALDRSGSQL
ncbi:MAG: hypothetical protein AAFV90_05505 [Cyanobacteria bacterium J06634_5]